MGLASFLGSVATSALGGAAGSGTLGALDGGWSTYSSGQSRTKYAAEKAYEMQQRAYRESPSAIREGLERAGINPLLATSAFGNASAGSGSFAEPSSGFSASLGFDGQKMLTSKDKREIVKSEKKSAVANADAVEEEARARKEEARLAFYEANARQSAFTGAHFLEGTPKVWSLIRDNFVRDLEDQHFYNSGWQRFSKEVRSWLPFLSVQGGSSARQGRFWRAGVFK